MPESKSVHWAPEERLATSLEDESPSYFPPAPLRIPILLPSNDDDSSSLVDSDAPSTPPPEFSPLANVVDPDVRTPPIPIRTAVTRPRVDSFSSHRIPEGQTGPCEPQSPLASGRSGLRMSGVPSSFSPSSPHGQAQRRASIVSPTRTRFGQDATPTLHVFLANSSNVKLVWNVLNVPAYNTVHLKLEDGSFLPIPAKYLLEAATNPPQKEMRIHCLPRSIPLDPLVVKASERRISQMPNSRSSGSGHDSPRSSSSRDSSLDGPDYVTIQDVIEEIYKYLRRRMSRDDFDALASTGMPQLKDKVASAFHDRCRTDETEATSRSSPPGRRNNVRLQLSRNRGTGTYHYPPPLIQSPSASSPRTGARTGGGASSAKSGGLRRVDCLIGQTQFSRLEMLQQDSRDWIARFGSPGP